MHARAARWVPAFLLVAAAGCTGMQQQEQAKPMVDQAAISARIDSLATAWSGAVTGKDTTVIASMYAEDAHVLPPNGKRIDGRDAVRHMWAGMFAMPGFDLKTVSNTKIVSEAQGQAMARHRQVHDGVQERARRVEGSRRRLQQRLALAGDVGRAMSVWSQSAVATPPGRPR